MTSKPSPISAVFTFALLAACSNAPSSGAEEVPPRFRDFSQHLQRELQALGIPGAAAAILEHGELAFAHGFGTKGRFSSEPVGAATLFRTGSMGKVVTAMAVLSAVDDGLLDLDAPLRDAIPDLSLQGAEADALTLRLLLSQQTGLRDYIAINASPDDGALAEFTSGAELRDNVDFMNPPGLFWNYSNPNYYLAGRALEAAAGLPYRVAIQDRVFQPLHMDRSFLLPAEVLADGDYSHGYGANNELGDGPLEELAPDAYDNGWARPAGFAFSNVLDWARLMQFLLERDPAVLSAGTYTELTSPQISTHSIYADLETTALGLGDDYGFGLGMGQGFFMDRRAEPEAYHALPFLGHGGDIPGFASTFAVFPSTGFGIVVLSNRDAARPVASLRLALESFAGLPEQSAPPPGRESDPSRFASYAGSYVSRDGTAVTVSESNGQLSVASPALDALGLPFDPILEPTSLDNFALWVTLNGQRVPLEVTFFPDGMGGYGWFRSRVVVAQRTAAAQGTAAAP